MRFDNKVVVVTGAASGIGFGVAQAFLDEGARGVVCVDRDCRGAAAAAERLVGARVGERALFLRADVSESAAPDDVFVRAERAFGKVDILVNSAGILRLSPALEMSVETFDEVISVDLRSVFLMSTSFARRLVECGRSGRIVNVTSVHAILSEPNACAYTAAKAGVEGLSRTLASELAQHGITVNCVRPGATWTALTAPIYTETVLRALDRRIPQRRIAQPAEIAAGVLYFASDAAAYSTGTTLDVDGGYVMDGSLPEVTYTAGGGG